MMFVLNPILANFKVERMMTEMREAVAAETGITGLILKLKH